MYEITLLLLESEDFEQNLATALERAADFLKLQSVSIEVDKKSFVTYEKEKSKPAVLQLSLPMIEKGQIIGSFNAAFESKSQHNIDTLHLLVPLFSKALKTHLAQKSFLQTSSLQTMERRFVLHIYQRCDYNVAKTAKALGLTPRQLRYKLKKYKQD